MNKLKRLLAISILILFILLCGGCSSLFKTKTTIEYVEVPVEIEKKCVSQYPDKILMREIKWLIVDDYYVALSPADYENLSLNTAEMLRWIKQAKTIIKKCEE